MKAKYQTWNNFRFNLKKHGSANNLPSETVPNQSFTIEEILNKFTRGIDPMLTKNGNYEFEGDVSDEVLNENIDMLEGIESLEEAEFMLDSIRDRVTVLKRQKAERAAAEKQQADSAS
jgi:hypothetical protein